MKIEMKMNIITHLLAFARNVSVSAAALSGLALRWNAGGNRCSTAGRQTPYTVQTVWNIKPLERVKWACSTGAFSNVSLLVASRARNYPSKTWACVGMRPHCSPESQLEAV